MWVSKCSGHGWAVEIREVLPSCSTNGCLALFTNVRTCPEKVSRVRLQVSGAGPHQVKGKKMSGSPQALRPSSYLVRPDAGSVIVTLNGLGSSGAGSRSFALDVPTAHSFQGLVSASAREQVKRTLDDAAKLFARPEPHAPTPFVIAWGAAPFVEPGEVADVPRVLAQLTSQDRPGFLSRMVGLGGRPQSGEPCVFVVPGDAERFATAILRAAVLAQQWIEEQENPGRRRDAASDGGTFDSDDFHGGTP